MSSPPADSTARNRLALLRAAVRSRLSFFFRTFKYRNYRLFFIGQGISFIGTWVHRIALGWLVFRITGSELKLGVVMFASLAPAFIVSPFAGELAERMDRRKILIAANAFAAVQAIVLGIITTLGLVQVSHIILFGALLGVASGFDIPVRHSFVVDIVEKREDLHNAIALNSSLFNIARIVGPIIAGLIVRIANEGSCFIVNGASFTLAIASMLAMTTKTIHHHKSGPGLFKRLGEGFTYSFRSPLIGPIIIFLAFLSLVVMPYFLLLTPIAKEILHGDALTFGLLAASTGIGSLVGAVFLAARKNAVGLEKNIPLAAVVFGIATILFSSSKTFWISMLIAPVCGFGILVQMASANTMLQTYVDNDKRGRVMSIYVMSFMGMAPIGNLLAGLAAEKLNVPSALMISGALCIAGAIVFSYWLPKIAGTAKKIRERDEATAPPDLEQTLLAAEEDID